MSFVDEFEKRYQREGYQVLGQLHKAVSFTISFGLNEAFKASSAYIDAVEDYSSTLNSPNRYRFFLAAGIQQILDSIQKKHWIGEAIPNYENALAKLSTVEDGQPSVPSKLEDLKDKIKAIEEKAKLLVKELGSDMFLAEYNNAFENKYDPLTQLYLANRLSIYLEESTAGYEFLAKTATYDPATQTATYLPIFNYTRFRNDFEPAPNKDPKQIAIPSTNYADPNTGELKPELAPKIKAVGDYIAGSWIFYEKTVLEGFAIHFKIVEKFEGKFADQFLEIVKASWRKVAPSIGDEAYQSLETAYQALLRTSIQERTNISLQIRQRSLYVTAPVIAIAGILSSVYAVVTFDHQNPDIPKIFGLGKDLIGSVGAISEAAHLVKTARGFGGFGKSAVLESMGNCAGVAAGVIDVGLNIYGVSDSWFNNPKNVLPESIKLLGSGISLGGSVYLAVSGAALFGPVGIGVAFGGLGLALIGSLLTKEDTHIEQFLLHSAFGDDYKFEDNLEAINYRYKFDTKYQWSTYFNLIYGFTFSIQGEIVGQNQIILHFSIRASQYHIPVTSKIRIQSIGTIPETNSNSRLFDHKFIVQKEGFHDDTTEVTPLYEKESTTDEFVLREWTLRKVISTTNPNAWIDKYFEVTIDFFDEGTLSFVKTLLMQKTGINANRLTLAKEVTLILRNKVQRKTNTNT
ncbi:hypothetical protein LC593_11975 [Nostoc sp. CHAB 5844]|nr:hypothetical protein [Nostoc sp. CHAB 5844]